LTRGPAYGRATPNLRPTPASSIQIDAQTILIVAAHDRPIFAYTNDDRAFHDRVRAFCGGAVRERLTGVHEDGDGMAIESFALRDNLMLEGGVIASGGCLVAAPAVHIERYSSLAAFERCVSTAAGLLRSDRG
jgi:hypothetical protein